MKLFYSYCHSDENFRERLEKFLCTLRDEGKIDEWCDRKILAGDKWNEKIQQELESADVVLFLVTQDFLASPACKDEIKYSIDPKNHKLTIPIILKPSTWLQTDLKHIQAVPKDGKPVVSWSSEDEAWLDVANKISLSIDEYIKHPRQSYLDELDKTEFISSDKGAVLLSDIFIEPEIDFIKIDGKESTVNFSIDDILTNDNRFCIFRGEELSGKTSLLRIIYKESSNKNYFPILIDGITVQKTKNFEKLISQHLVEQYDSLNIEQYKSKLGKILLIDNFNHSISDNFITWAKSFFDYVYLTIDTDEQMLFYKGSKIFVDFNTASIKPLKQYSRYELIKKWKILSREIDSNEEMFQNEIDQLERNVNSIILDKNIVPSTPFYILTIIQSFETFMPNDFKITSYGHCYHALIVAKLINSGISTSDIDDCFNYLTYISKAFYEEKVSSIGFIEKREYIKIKEEYKQTYLISDGLISRLEDTATSIFKFYEKDDTDYISFAYPFIFYFFFGRNIALRNDKKTIEDLCEKIYLRDYANILIFTIHHSNDVAMLEEIELHCMVSFDAISVAKLSSDETEFMNELMDNLPKEITSSRSSEENRIEVRKENDKLEEVENNHPVPTVTEDSNKEIKDIEKSLKIVEVLGQIIKNRCGSLPIPKTKELIMEVENLNFRILTFFLNTLKEEDFKKWISERISLIEKENNGNLPKSKIEKIVEQNIQVMGFCIIIGTIQKAFQSLSTQKILPLQEQISTEQDTTAFDFLYIFFKLSFEGIKFSFIEKYYKKFTDNNNTWAKKVLSLIVQSYLNSHNVDFRIRQQLSALLGFTYHPNKPAIHN